MTPTQFERAVAPPPGRYTRCLREEYVLICGGDPCAAMILSQHEFWHQHNTRRRPGGDPWSAVSYPEMRDQLFGLFSVKSVREAYGRLVERGLLARRTSPTRPTDRTFQYLFVVGAVQRAVDALGAVPARPGGEDQAPPREDATVPTAPCKSPHGSVSVKNIPESSPENTPKTSPPATPPPPTPPELGAGGDLGAGGRSPERGLAGELVSFGIAFEEARTLVRDHGAARCRLVLDHLPPYPTPVRQGRWLRKALAEDWAVGPPPRAWPIRGAADLDALLAAHGPLPVAQEVERRASEPGITEAQAHRRRRVAAGLRAGLSGRDAHAAAGYAPDG